MTDILEPLEDLLERWGRNANADGHQLTTARARRDLEATLSLVRSSLALEREAAGKMREALELIEIMSHYITTEDASADPADVIKTMRDLARRALAGDKFRGAGGGTSE